MNWLVGYMTIRYQFVLVSILLVLAALAGCSSVIPPYICSDKDELFALQVNSFSQSDLVVAPVAEFKHEINRTTYPLIEFIVDHNEVEFLGYAENLRFAARYGQAPEPEMVIEVFDSLTDDIFKELSLPDWNLGYGLGGVNLYDADYLLLPVPGWMGFQIWDLQTVTRLGAFEGRGMLVNDRQVFLNYHQSNLDLYSFPDLRFIGNFTENARSFANTQSAMFDPHLRIEEIYFSKSEQVFAVNYSGDGLSMLAIGDTGTGQVIGFANLKRCFLQNLHLLDEGSSLIGLCGSNLALHYETFLSLWKQTDQGYSNPVEVEIEPETVHDWYSSDKWWFYGDESVLSPDDQLLAVVSKSNEKVQIWDLENKALVTEITGLSADFSHNGEILAVGLQNGSIELLDTDDYSSLYSLLRNDLQSPVVSIRFSEDDLLMLVEYADDQAGFYLPVSFAIWGIRE